jgi:hypothetical protein
MTKMSDDALLAENLKAKCPFLIKVDNYCPYIRYLSGIHLLILWRFRSSPKAKAIWLKKKIQYKRRINAQIIIKTLCIYILFPLNSFLKA